MQGILRVIQDTVGFFAALIRPSAKSIADNRALFGLSVILAFALWIFVTDSENPTRTRILPIDIPVEPTEVADDVAINSDILPVRVRITVADDVFDSLNSTDFEATIDLTGYGVGQHEDVPVEVETLTSRGGLRVESVIPDTVGVELAQLTSKSVPVDVVVSGDVAPGYTMGLPQHEDTVIVTGPEEEVAKVQQASANIDVGSRTESVDQAIRLSPRTERGFLVQRVNLDPDVVNVRIDIEQDENTRPLPINVVTAGSPAEGYNVTGVSVDPPTVIVRGEETFIDSVFAIDTQPVDIDGANDDIEQSVSLDLPGGATVPGGEPVVTVTIAIEPAVAEFNFSVPIETRNLGAGLTIQGGIPTVQVTLVGSFPVLRQLEPANIKAFIDLTDVGAGTHGVEVQIDEIDDVTSASSEPATIQVVIGQG